MSQLLNQSSASLVNTVRKNYEGFTRHEVEKAILARKAHGRVGNPSDAEFVKMVSDKPVQNLPVAPIYVSNALAIFGHNLSRVKGGTLRTKPYRVDTEFDIEIPRDFYKLNRFFTITSDGIFVKGIPFLTTFSRKIRMFSVEFIPSWTAAQLSRSLMKIVCIYVRGGFMVNVIFMD